MNGSQNGSDARVDGLHLGSGPQDIQPLEVRRKRAMFRACHRGTKEMDWLLGRFADARLAEMDTATLTAFEDLLGVEDPILYAWLMDPSKISEPAHAAMVEAVRNHHNITGASDVSKIKSAWS